VNSYWVSSVFKVRVFALYSTMLHPQVQSGKNKPVSWLRGRSIHLFSLPTYNPGRGCLNIEVLYSSNTLRNARYIRSLVAMIVYSAFVFGNADLKCGLEGACGREIADLVVKFLHGAISSVSTSSSFSVNTISGLHLL